jgi:hypothetical protein
VPVVRRCLSIDCVLQQSAQNFVNREPLMSKAGFCTGDSCTCTVVVSKYDVDDEAAIPQLPSTTYKSLWYEPIRLTALLCYAVIITYSDVGLFASNGATGTETAEGIVIHPGMKVGTQQAPFPQNSQEAWS